MARRTRRGLLRGGGRWLALPAGTAIAGCAAFGIDLGRRQPYEVPPRTDTVERTEREGVESPESSTDGVEFKPLTPPEPGEATYRQWLPPPGDLFPNRTRYHLQYVEPFWIRAFRLAIPDGFDRHRSYGKVGLDYFGIGFENYQWILRVDGWTAVAIAQFDPTDVAETLAASGYELSADHRGLDLFTRDDGPRAVGVGNGVVVWSASGTRREPSPDPVVVVRALADAKAGARPRYHEVDEGFDALSAVAGAPLVGRVFPGVTTYLRGWDLDDLAGWGANWAFDQTASYRRTVFGFTGNTPPVSLKGELRREVARREFYRRANAVDVTVTDRSATVVAAFHHDNPSRPFGETSSEVTYPQITWGYEYDPAASEVTITHEAGDAVPAAVLNVTNTTVHDVQQFSDSNDVVGPSDSVTVSTAAEGSGTIRIRWRSPAEGRQVVISRYDVPARPAD